MKKRTAGSDRSLSTIISNSINKIIIWVIACITLISVFVLATGQYSACARNFDVATGLASDRVYWALQSYKNIVSGIGYIPALSDPDFPLEDKINLLNTICKEYGLVRSKIINTDGFSDMDDKPIYRGDRDYFDEAMKGNTYIQEPVTSRTDGRIAIIGAAPLWKDGLYGGEIAGVVFISIDPVLLSDIIEGVDLSKNSFAYIIDHNGYTVASTDMQEVLDKNNNIINSIKDPSYRSIANIERKMVRGEIGSDTIRMNGHLYYLSYTTIPETPGWSLCIGSAYIDYLDTFLLLMLLMAECLVITVFIVKIRSTRIAEEVGEPVRRMTESIKKAAESGTDMSTLDLSKMVGASEEPLEMKIISEAMDSILDRLDLATTDTREFLDSAVITDLVSMEMLRYINGYYKTSFGVNVIVADSKGVVLVGKTNHGLVDANALREDESACFIMLNDRVIGSTIFKIPEDCILDKNDAQQHAIYVSKILEIVAFGNFSRSLQSRNKLKHAREELERISAYHIEIGEAARKMADEGERIRKAGNPDEFRDFLGRFISFCYELVSRTDDFTDNNDRSDISVRVKEQVYAVDNLVTDLKNDFERMHPLLADKLSVKVASEIPGKLFGDAHRIRRMVENLVLALSDEFSPEPVEIYIESRKVSYSTSISISIRGNRVFADKERIRLKQILESEREEGNVVDNINASELKLLSLVRVVRRMNGKFRVNVGSEGETWCTVIIPQLEVGIDDK